MYVYNVAEVRDFLGALLRKHATGAAWTWLEAEGAAARGGKDVARFNIAFVSMPRKTGKAVVVLTPAEQRVWESLQPGMQLSGWTLDQVGRAWLLLQQDPGVQERYVSVIENLFRNAEMAELVALYASLPLLAYPEQWKKRCAEGIRSNIGQVLSSIICDNPYPAAHLGEQAWNQMVLKAIFTDKPLLSITGLRNRLNENLANSLSDYAHERWAAHRTVNPLLWMCVAQFIDERIFADIRRLMASEDLLERKAAALACHDASFAPAKKLLEERKDLRRQVEEGTLSWEALAREMESAVKEQN